MAEGRPRPYGSGHMTYAIFTWRTPRTERTMHAAREGARETVCHLPIGRGTGLVRDGDYWNNRPCPRCWPAAKSSHHSDNHA
jgi:hypothetical protein